MKEHNMKRIVVLLATLLLSFGLTNAANIVQVDLMGNLDSDTLRADIQGYWAISLENDALLGGCSFGFITSGTATYSMSTVGGAFVTSPAGPNFVVGLPGTRWMTANATDGSCWDLGGSQVSFDPGTYPGQFLIGGAGLMYGLAAGGLEHMLDAYYVIDHLASNDDVETLCIDSAKYGPAGDFIFVPGGIPEYIGPGCMPVTNPRDFCPAWDTPNPTSMTVNHCAVGQVTVAATDPEQQAVYYYLIGTTGAGTATVNMNSGLVTYTPNAADVGSAVTITVEATDAVHQEGGCVDDPMVINVTVTNNGPTITCGAGEGYVGKGNTFTKDDIAGNDLDACDVLTYALSSMTPTPVNAPTVDPATGAFTWVSDDTEGDVDFDVCIAVTDGFTETQCCFVVHVLSVEPWEVQIEKTHGTHQGHFVDVAITLNKGSEPMGGFDFLIAYDASALAFTEASLGSYLQSCGWEYFTYRFNWNGNCGNACPSGLLRLVGMAETNNGANHPDVDCIKNAKGHVIANLTFFVSNDRTLECMYVPIRFYWMDCGDNTISTIAGDTLAMNRYIYDFVNNMSEIQDYLYGFPGWYGAPDYCLEGDKVHPVRFVDFINGGIDIVCGDSIDARGDINVNGVGYEIADAVMFTNYYISGLSAFGSHVEASIAASDVNADGLTLSVADLVYLVRVIVGDANPYPKPMPDAQAVVSAQGGAVTVDAPLNLGAALLTFHVNGEIGTPVLGVDMDMKYARSGDELRVLIYNIGSKAIPAGENLLVTVPGNVELTGAEVASYEGFTVESSINRLPMAFSLQQNFPNPFNPTTTIALNMPVESDYSITIFNVAGQKVREFAGHSAAGVLEVVWDGNDANGSNVASGIYFYRATTDKFSETKKMVLMK
jgi:hypothetical protein